MASELLRLSPSVGKIIPHGAWVRLTCSANRLTKQIFLLRIYLSIDGYSDSGGDVPKQLLVLYQRGFCNQRIFHLLTCGKYFPYSYTDRPARMNAVPSHTLSVMTSPLNMAPNNNAVTGVINVTMATRSGDSFFNR